MSCLISDVFTPARLWEEVVTARACGSLAGAGSILFSEIESAKENVEGREREKKLKINYLLTALSPPPNSLPALHIPLQQHGASPAPSATAAGVWFSGAAASRILTLRSGRLLQPLSDCQRHFYTLLGRSEREPRKQSF